MRPIENVIWISQHSPTPLQLEEIEEMRFIIQNLASGIEIGKKILKSDGDVNKIVREIDEAFVEAQAEAMFGVFAVPLLHQIYRRTRADHSHRVFGAWNINRAAEGQKPTFEHFKFLQIGVW